RIDYNSSEALAPVIEALLFASDEALSAQELRSLILGEEAQKIDAASTEVSELSTEVDSDDTIAEGESAISEKKRKRKMPIELPVIHAAVEQLNTAYTENLRAFRII